MGGHRYNLSTMNAAEFLPDVRAVLEERNEPSYRIRQIYKALTGSLVRDWKEATNLLRFSRTDTGFSATLKEEAKRFLGYAREVGRSATLRPSRGQDIDAACGQLAAKDLRGRAFTRPDP